jgi:hypothetical protein
MGVHYSKPIPSNKKGDMINQIDRATLDLKISRDKLSRYRAKLTLDSDLLATRARSLHADGKTNNAIQLLRLRKFKLQEANRADEELLTILRMVDSVAERHNERDVLLAMKRGTDALQLIHEQIRVDDILELMDEIRDQDEVERRINLVLGREDSTTEREEDQLEEFDRLTKEVKLEEDIWKGEMGEGATILPLVPHTMLPAVKQTKTSKSMPNEAKIAVVES